jgi:hypothetical protein
MKKLKLTKEEQSICEDCYRLYPKPFKSNKVVPTYSSMITFYNSTKPNGNRFYEYMNRERMISLAYQSLIANQKDEVIEIAIKFIRKLLKVVN